MDMTIQLIFYLKNIWPNYLLISIKTFRLLIRHSVNTCHLLKMPNLNWFRTLWTTCQRKWPTWCPRRPLSHWTRPSCFKLETASRCQLWSSTQSNAASPHWRTCANTSRLQCMVSAVPRLCIPQMLRSSPSTACPRSRHNSAHSVSIWSVMLSAHLSPWKWPQPKPTNSFRWPLSMITHRQEDKPHSQRSWKSMLFLSSHKNTCNRVQLSSSTDNCRPWKQALKELNVLFVS